MKLHIYLIIISGFLLFYYYLLFNIIKIKFFVINIIKTFKLIIVINEMII